jgi:hypothetical protein
MKFLKGLLSFLLFCSVFLHAHAQLVDTVINMGIYKSYFSYSIKEPLYVTYPLYKGEGKSTGTKKIFVSNLVELKLLRMPITAIQDMTKGTWPMLKTLQMIAIKMS